METINLGAVLFALLLLLWVAYALPRTAGRREVMGRARAQEIAEMSSEARDLSEAVHARRSPSREVTAPMPQDRLLLRPADPTRRPRFDADPGVRIDLSEERQRSRRLMRVLLAALALGTAALVVAAVIGPVSWWVPLISGGALLIYLAGLRRAEVQRRARATRAATLARQERAEQETARRAAARGAGHAPAPGTRASAPGAGPVEPAATVARVSGEESEAPVRRAPLETTSARAAEQVAAPGEWIPRPVPLPTYALRGEVDDLATRHAAHRESLRATAVPLERDGVEAIEAADEAAAPPALDLGLDEVLARRRA